MVLCRLDSLVIARNQNYENYQINIRYRRSSSQRRLCRVSQLLCSQLRIQAIGRRLQSSRPYLDKLKPTACLHIWTVRQPHTRQRQRWQNTPPSPTCLNNALHATQSEDSISSFMLAQHSFFPQNIYTMTADTKVLVLTLLITCAVCYAMLIISLS